MPSASSKPLCRERRAAPALIETLAKAGPRGSNRPADALALYVHWPFCVSKCPYCDFNSHVRASVDQDQWRNALLADLAHEARATPGRPLGSIFFGGGTPSLMPPATVAALIEAAQEYWGFADDIEITLEANPSSVEAARFADLASAGVNRVSLGLQSLDDADLHFLGRAHDSLEGMMALGTAQSAFPRVSFDLIYALPGQTLERWSAMLEQALGFGTTHLSLYQLTIEPGTRFATLAARGELPIPDPDHGAALYELTQALTEQAGLPAYEISNHAAPGQESRHNLAYWRYDDHGGIGPGAHGRRGGRFVRRHRKPENWLASIDASGHGIAEEEEIAPADKGAEALIMGLRLREGVDLDRITRLAGRDPVDRAAIHHLADQGLVELSGPRLRATAAGMLVLDSLLAKIVLN